MELNLDVFNYKDKLPEQRKLFVECFPENIGTPVIEVKHYLWKFHSFPSKPASFEYAVLNDGELIGYYAAIPYSYNVNGAIHTVGMVCDVMTGVKARGKGVFTKLGRYSIKSLQNEGISFTTGYPIRPEVIPGHKKVGWSFPFELPMYGKFLSFKSFFKSKRLSNLTFFANGILKITNNTISLFRKKSANINIEVYNQHDVDLIIGLNDFFEKVSNEVPIYLNKNSLYLKWRLGAPKKEYSIIVLRDKGEIVGYSVSRKVLKQNVYCWGILDIAILKGYEKNASMLYSKNEELARKSGAELILTMIGRKWAKIFKFKKNGYIRTPYKFSFIINKLNPDLSDKMLLDERNWHLMWIDSDDL